jgi:hypothetical protein
MMPLSRQEKEELVRDLYFNEGKTYHEIAKQARVSLRDIKSILNRGTQGAQGEQSLSKAAQSYDMFSKNKSPMEVAVTLDLREPEVTQLYKESWTLKQIHDLNQIYLKTGGNLAPFLNLYKLNKAAAFNAEHVVWLLRVANNDLPELERRYYNLKSEVDSLEEKKQNLVRIIQNYNGQVIALGKIFDSDCLRCEQEEKKLADLQTKRIRAELLL